MTKENSLSRFLKDERGTIVVEFLLYIPLLIWTWIALTVFWDAFRTINTAQKAAYSVSDLITRQEDNLSPSFVDGMQDVFNYLMGNNTQNTRMRITSLVFKIGDVADKSDDQYKLIFSVSPDNTLTPYTEGDLQMLSNRIPLMGDRDSVVLVETFVDYTYPFRIPFISAGVVRVDETQPNTVQVFDEFVVTRPRFKSYICLESPGCPASF
jgi:hypothetical protein